MLKFHQQTAFSSFIDRIRVPAKIHQQIRKRAFVDGFMVPAGHDLDRFWYNQCKEGCLQRDLADLIEKGIISQEEIKKAPRYRLNRVD